MLIHGKMVERNLHFIAEKTPEFLNRIALEFECLQDTLHFFVVGYGSFDRCRFSSILMFFTDGVDDFIPIAVNSMGKVFLLGYENFTEVLNISH